MAWGVIAADSAPGFQPFAFAGGVFDSDTGFTHFGFRDYDAASAGWTAMDPIRLGVGYLSPEPMLQDPAWVRRKAQTGMSAPTYAYAANNPLRFTDPSGLDTVPGLPSAPNGLCTAARPVPFLVVPASAPGDKNHTICILQSEARELKTLCQKLNFCLDFANGLSRNDPAYGQEVKELCEETFICRIVSCDPPSPEAQPFTGNSSPTWSAP